MQNLTFIGDIHSAADDLKVLLTDPVIQQSQIIFMGDYIDGLTERRFADHTEPVVNDPLGVLDILMARVGQHGDIALLGNHDDFWLETARHKEQGYETWKINGGLSTWQHLGITATSLKGVGNALKRDPLKKYTSFLKERPITWQNADILAVHAGINWDYSLNDQRRDDELWIRGDYYYTQGDPQAGWHRNQLGKIIITGHTPVQLIMGPTYGLGYLKLQATADDVPRYIVDSGSHSGAVDGGIFALTLTATGEEVQKKRVVKGKLYDGATKVTADMVRDK